mmetsp:Transcript_5079/g.9193  ORF Transcript_5079/g.9193 Transcript_5079/m.9193 type:complete len:519 (-) Transcript_5079:133-1689(-)
MAVLQELDPVQAAAAESETAAPQAEQAAAPAEGPAAPEAPPGIFVGAPVTIDGLKSAAQYNGCKGTVTKAAGENGRYEITVTQDDQNAEPKVLALKPANFELDTEALKEYILRKREEKRKRDVPLEDEAMMWMKGKGLSVKSLTSKISEVPPCDEGCVVLRVDKFSMTQMSIGYLMKGFTRTFGGYHNFFPSKQDGIYRSAAWGIATVVESSHLKVPVGTRLYGPMPLCKYHHQKVLRTIPRLRNGEDPPVVEFQNEDMPFNMQRFQEYEVLADASAADPEFEDWKLATKEIYTMAFYMDEQLLTETGQINSVIISCASSKTAMALAYCLKMRGGSAIEREMEHLVGLTSKEHYDFVVSTDLYQEVYTYDEVDNLPTDKTIVYMDFKCDGALRQAITMKLGTNLMYNMVLGPAVFQKRMKDQLFEKKAREVIFDESTWRERRRMVAEVTKTGRNEKLRYSYKSYVERMKKYVSVRHHSGMDQLKQVYESIYGNQASPAELHICSMHPDEFAVEQIWSS